jgi:hypothetical protein
VNLAPDALAEGAVYQLVPRERPQACERGTHQQCAEVNLVLGMHLDPRIRKGTPNQFLNFLWVHADHIKTLPPARTRPQAPHPGIMLEDSMARRRGAIIAILEAVACMT